VVLEFLAEGWLGSWGFFFESPTFVVPGVVLVGVVVGLVGVVPLWEVDTS